MTTTAVPIHVLDADSTRAEVEEALGFANTEAIRMPHVMARKGCPPSAWDRRHAFIDELLTMWQAAE